MSSEWNFNGIFPNDILDFTDVISMQFVDAVFTIFFAILNSICQPMEFFFTIHQNYKMDGNLVHEKEEMPGGWKPGSQDREMCRIDANHFHNSIHCTIKLVRYIIKEGLFLLQILT